MKQIAGSMDNGFLLRLRIQHYYWICLVFYKILSQNTFKLEKNSYIMLKIIIGYLNGIILYFWHLNNMKLEN